MHGSAVDDRSEEVVDDPVGDEHQHQQDERGLRPDGAERDEQHGRHGQEGADVRDEAAQDHEDRKRQHIRHAEHHEEDGVGRCPGCRQDCGSPEVATDALERIPTARVDPRALRIRRDLEQPIPRALAVIEDEEGEDQGEDGDGDDRRNHPDHAADRRPEPCADAIGCLLDEGTDHGWERQSLKLSPQLRDPRPDRVDHLDGVGDEGQRDDQQDDHAEQEEQERRKGRGLRLRPSAGAEPADHRRERGRHDQREQHGDRDRPEQDGQPDRDGGQARDGEQPPAQCAEAAQPTGDDDRVSWDGCRHDVTSTQGGRSPRSPVSTVFARTRAG